MWKIGSEWNGPFEGEGFDLNGAPIPPEAIECLRAEDAREMSVMPVEWSEAGVVVAMSEWDQEALDKLQFIWGRPVSVVYAKAEAIRKAIEEYYP